MKVPQTSKTLSVGKSLNNEVSSKDDMTREIASGLFSFGSKKRIKNRLSHYKDYDKIDEEVDKELENMGLVKVIDGKKYYMNGYKKKRDKLLGEKYNIYRDKNSIFS